MKKPLARSIPDINVLLKRHSDDDYSVGLLTLLKEDIIALQSKNDSTDKPVPPIFQYNIERLHELIEDKDLSEKHKIKLRSLVIHLTRADNDFFLARRRHPKEHWPTNDNVHPVIKDLMETPIGSLPGKTFFDGIDINKYKYTKPIIEFDMETPQFTVSHLEKVVRVDPNDLTAVRQAYRFIESNPDFVVIDKNGMGVNNPDDPRLKSYKLLRSYVTPTETIQSGVVKTGFQWIAKFNDLKKEDFAIKTEWFELVEEKTYSENDMRRCFTCARYLRGTDSTFLYRTFDDFTNDIVK